MMNLDAASTNANATPTVVATARRVPPAWSAFSVAWLIALSVGSVAWAGPLSEKPAPGPYCPLDAAAHAATQSFTSTHPVVGTSYFYWYDVYSGSHIRNADGTDALTNHPLASAMADLSYKSAEWHYSQLRDIREAGIDFILPVYWGVPGEYGTWSFVGLPPLIEAHNRMFAEARADAASSSQPAGGVGTGPARSAPPKIGLFFDTSTLYLNKVNADGAPVPGEKIDLTTDAGREWFYVTIRDFFSMIPPDKWARIDGKPIVFLYAASFAKAVDENVFPDTRKRFAKDFGVEPFIVREVSWPGPADASYAWGGALGLTLGENVAGIGPGYDHSAVPGRKPLVVGRQNGAFYARQWEKLLRMKTVRRPWMVHLETWNEWHEGTDLARSQEYGDQYIRATSGYARMFKTAVQLDPQGPFTRAERVRWSGRQVEGVELLPSGKDGCWQTILIDGSAAIYSTPCAPDGPAAYLYFDVDDSYMYDEIGRSAEVTIVFRDDGDCERFQIQYDSADSRSSIREGAFSPGRAIELGSSGTWRTVKQILPGVRFANRSNNADFRLAVTGGKRRLSVREVIVRKLAGTQ